MKFKLSYSWALLALVVATGGLARAQSRVPPRMITPRSDGSSLTVTFLIRTVIRISKDVLTMALGRR